MKLVTIEYSLFVNSLLFLWQNLLVSLCTIFLVPRLCHYHQISFPAPAIITIARNSTQALNRHTIPINTKYRATSLTTTTDGCEIHVPAAFTTTTLRFSSFGLRPNGSVCRWGRYSEQKHSHGFLFFDIPLCLSYDGLETEGLSVAFVNLYQTTRRHIHEDQEPSQAPPTQPQICCMLSSG
jgi:hypothetical protein